MRFRIFIAAGMAVLLAGCAVRSPESAAQRVSYYRARARGPTAYPAYARLGNALLDRYEETGDERVYGDAVANLELSLAYQRNYAAVLGMARALALRHRFHDALPYAQEAVETLPESAEAAGVLIDIHLALGETAAAERVLDRVLRSSPGFASYTRAAALAEHRGRYRAALEWMGKALADAEKRALGADLRAWCHVRLGALQMFVHEPAPARMHYQEALTLMPEYFFAREHLGEWHAAHGHWREAEQIYRSLVNEYSEPMYRAALAEAVEAQGRTNEANGHLQAAFKELRRGVNSGAEDHLRDLVILLLCDGSSAEEALALARRDHDLRQDRTTKATLAWALCATGQHEQAWAVAESAASEGVADPVVLLPTALIQAKRGKLGEARQLMERARDFELAFTVSERRALAQVLAAAAVKGEKRLVQQQAGER